MGSGKVNANEYIKAADILLERGFSPVQIYALGQKPHVPCDPYQGCGIEREPWTDVA